MICDYTAGWISGVVSLLIGHPFDTIKIQQQVYGLQTREAINRIYTHRGLKGFYRGLLVPIITSGTLNAVFFGVYGDICDYLVKIRRHNKGYWKVSDESHPEFEPLYKEALFRPAKTEKDEYQLGKTKTGATFTEMFVAGSIAGMVQLTLSCPAELVKTKLQSQMKRKIFKGPFDCFFTVARDRGVRGIYRGLVPMMFRDVPGGGIYFVIYEGLKGTLQTNSSSPFRIATTQIIAGGVAVGSGINFTVICNIMHLCQKDLFPTSWKQQITATGLAGIASWWFVLPFDVIKTRMQADDHKYPKYKNMLHCAKDIYKSEGPIGLFRGFWSCTARAFPVNAATFLVYELFQTRICDRYSTFR